MKFYPDYIQSGIDWIGEIPSHWTRYKVKHIGTYINGYAFKPTHWCETGLPIIRIQDLTGTTNNPNFFNGSIPKKYLIENNDILISWAATLDVFIWNQGQAWLNQHIFKAIPNQKLITPKFFYWLLKLAMRHMNEDNKHGIMMEHITADLFDNYEIFLPPIHEQNYIAKWLDCKCETIDALIEKEKRRIDLLNELKLTIITTSVTQGLNHDVSLKESEIEWIEQIPSHWNKWRLKFTGQFGNGLTYSPHDVVEEGVCVLRSSNVQDGKLSFDDNVFVLNCPEKLMTEIGDIIICSRNGSANLVGKCALVSEKINATFGAFMMRYRPYINPKFAYYLFNATYRQYRGLFSTTTINQLTKTVIDTMDVPIPPINEQEAIASYLDSECGKIDSQIDQINREIGLLEEYKQSVITQVVTGKRRVCEVDSATIAYEDETHYTPSIAAEP